LSRAKAVRKFERRVPRKPSKLPSTLGCVYVRCFIINKQEVTKGGRETHMFSSDAKDVYISVIKFGLKIA